MGSRECEEEEIRAKQEGDHNHNHNQVNLNQMLQQQQQQSSSTSRQWTSAFRNPRIVRVSRTFGGKDRHSKVCTVRGLRDRRIRLSVPTAIQLYDLQDRLGLSQPSKVIDWLLEAAKDDVDELPPLQFPHGFNQMYPNLIFGNTGFGESSSSTSAFPGTNLGFLENWDLGGSSSRTRPSRITDTTTTQRESFDLDKGKWVKHDENSNQDHVFDSNHHQHFSISSQNNNLSNNPFNNNNNNNTSSYYNLGHLQHSLDQSGNNVTVAIPNVVNNNNSNIAGDGSQLFFGPPPPHPPAAAAATMSSLFPTYPSFLGASHHHHQHVVDGAGHLQLFSSNANTASQQQMMTGNSSLIRPFHHLMSSNHDTDHQSSDNDSDS